MSELLTTPDTGARELEYFDDVLGTIEEVYEHIRWLSRYESDAHRKNTTHAVGLMAALGLRHLRAARGDLGSGWGPESIVHVRAAWEASIDIAFLLSTSGAKRWELSEQYQAMMMLRMPRINDAAARGVMSDEFVETVGRLREQYKDSPGLNPRNHWSGGDRGEIRRLAYEYFNGLMGERAENFAQVTKDIIFDEHGSPMVHADPGALIWLRLDEQGWPGVKPQRTGLVRPVHVAGPVVGIQILFGIGQRGTAAHREKASELLDRLGELLAVED